MPALTCDVLCLCEIFVMSHSLDIKINTLFSVENAAQRRRAVNMQFMAQQAWREQNLG